MTVVTTPGHRPVERELTITVGLAAVGAAVTVWCAWGFVAWLADRPATVTRFADPWSASWVAARVLEAAAVGVGVIVLRFLARDCQRQGRLTFDAMFCGAGAVTMLLDPTTNFVQPVFFYTSNFLNLGSWCGHLPGVVNPDCGRLPQPVLFDFCVYAFALLPAAALLGIVMDRAGRRRPGRSAGAVIGIGLAAAIGLELLVEVAVGLLHLWGYPGSPGWMSVIGNDHRLPLHSVVGGTIFFFGLAALRHFRDDRGLRFTERGLERFSPRRRTILAGLALCGAFQLLLLTGNVLINLGGFYATPYPKMPASFVNGLCDPPGLHGTAYGPCPGSPMFRLRVRR